MRQLVTVLLAALIVAVPASGHRSQLAGKQLLPREVAAESWKYWRNYELTKAVAVALAESAGSLGAWHDNLDQSGAVVSRDLGLYQLNVPADAISTDTESTYRTESTDPAVYQPVWQANTQRAYQLYTQPWTGRPLRLWQPWVAYTTGWATFPQWWVWHQKDGQPVGPWLPTGRYLMKAISGQANAHILIFRDWTPEVALSYAHRYAAHFGVVDTLYVSSGLVTWHVPAKPPAPPADGIGPRPVPNQGA